MHPVIAAAIVNEFSARRLQAGREHRAARARSPLAVMRGAVRRRRAVSSPGIAARHAPLRAGR
jgi:hypothetical protein